MADGPIFTSRRGLGRLEDPVAPQVDGSLGRLGLEHADLFVFHNLSDTAVYDRLCHP